MQPGTIATGTIKAVKHGMDAKHIKHKHVRMDKAELPPTVYPSLIGSIATRIPQAMLRLVVMPVEITTAATGLIVAKES